MTMGPRNSVAFTVVVTVAVAVGALLTLMVLALSGAPGTTLLATALAAVPVGPVLAAYLWLDRYEPEPASCWPPAWPGAPSWPRWLPW